MTHSRRRPLPTLALMSSIVALAAGCTVQQADDDDGPGSGGGGAGGPAPTGLPILGGGTHDIATLDVLSVATGTDGLNAPRDVAFNPFVPGEAWIVNFADNSMVIVADMGGAGQRATRHNSFGSEHFLSSPSSLAFGDNGNMATAQDEDQVTQPDTPADFMGPTLWSTDPNIFDAGHFGHLDMLHNSPLAMGIAWEVGNAYWVFDGFHSALTRYDFGEPHEPGGTDHSDGVVGRYVEGEVARVHGVGSHMVFDHASGLLWVADTGNSRIAILDPRTANASGSISPNYDGGVQQHMLGGTLWTFIDTTEHGFNEPSGLELHDGYLFVSAVDTGTIYAFDVGTGELVDYLPTGGGRGSIEGFAFDAAGNLIFVDPLSHIAVRIRPKE